MEEKPLWLPSIHAVRATQVPPIKYRNRSITFSMDFDTGKKTEYDPVLSSMSKSHSQKKGSEQSPERTLDRSMDSIKSIKEPEKK